MSKTKPSVPQAAPAARATRRNPTAADLKNILWENLTLLKEQKITPERANAIAYSAKEFMRIVREQRAIAQLTGQNPTGEFAEFYGVDNEHPIPQARGYIAPIQELMK